VTEDIKELLSEIPEGTELSKDVVFDVLRFARELGYTGYLTPMLVNQRMQDISMNPLSATSEGLTSALADPKNNEIALQGYSEDLELQSMVYKRLIDYCSTILSFDVSYDAINAEFSDYKSPKYKKDLKIVEEFLDRFDYKKEFQGVVRQLLRNEAYFGLTRFEGQRHVLQEFPSSPNYTKITGRSDVGGLLWSANMYWFLIPGVDLRMYPSFFGKAYENAFTGSSSKYNPSLPGDMRGSSSWVYWQDIPLSVGWAFKLNPELATRIPYFSPLLLDLVQQGTVRNLQRSIYMAAAAKILVGAVPLLKDTKATVRDSLAMSPDVLAKFLALVKTALGDSIKVAAAPLEDMQQINFESENIYDPFLKTALATSGINTNLIFSSNIKPNAIETQLSLEVDSNILKKLYSQFNAFMNYHANQYTSKFKFEFHFEGTNFFTDRNERFEKVNTLADKGIVLPHKIAAALGMKPAAFQRQLDEARANGWVDNLTPIVSGFNMKQGGELEKGRPKKATEELGDSGAQTRDSASNLGRGGKE